MLRKVSARWGALVFVISLVMATSAGAQSLGPFTWQLLPYCNVITLRATPNGPGYGLDGTDDLCGTGLPVPIIGTAAPGPGGVIAIDVLTPGPNGLGTDLRGQLLPAVLRGPWTDSQGRSGTMEFGVRGPLQGGTLRPVPLLRGADIADGSIGAVDVDSAQIQRRVTGACGAGQFAQGVGQDGTLTCNVAAGGGDITAVTAGLGLTGGAVSGDAILGVDTAVVQARIGASCAQGLFMTGASAGGTPTCTDGVATGAGTTGVGSSALANNTGDENTAVGENALGFNTSGYKNTAVGDDALWLNVGGFENTAVGDDALVQNSNGYDNTALGQAALYSNTGGFQNTALGQAALGSNVGGADNTAIGDDAMRASVTGDRNTAIGSAAMKTTGPGGSDNVALGYQALMSAVGSRNIAIGSGTGTSGAGSDSILIGSQTAVPATPTIRIGNPLVQTRAFVAGVFGASTGLVTAVPVLVDSNGQLGTMSSSRRYKFDIVDMGARSDGLLKLRPVTFRYKKPYADGSTPIEYGLIAEEVAEVYPDLVSRNGHGDVETVQYQKLTPMLLNELQRQARVTDSQRREIERLNAALVSLAARLAELEPGDRRPRR